MVAAYEETSVPNGEFYVNPSKILRTLSRIGWFLRNIGLTDEDEYFTFVVPIILSFLECDIF